jgi:hypothetical protein
LQIEFGWTGYLLILTDGTNVQWRGLLDMQSVDDACPAPQTSHRVNRKQPTSTEALELQMLERAHGWSVSLELGACFPATGLIGGCLLNPGPTDRGPGAYTLVYGVD